MKIKLRPFIVPNFAIEDVGKRQAVEARVESEMTKEEKMASEKKKWEGLDARPLWHTYRA